MIKAKTILVLAALNGFFAVNFSFAQTWTQTTVTSGANAVASSADGTKLVAGGSAHPAIYTSTNSGATWVANNTVSNFYLQDVTSSADGTKLVLVGIAEAAIHFSTDSGATWVSHSTPGLYWQSVASSADGTKLVAVEENGAIFTSTDSGTIWTSNSTPLGYWSSVASSADGSKLVAATISSGSVGDAHGIYTSYSTPAPSLNLTASNSNLAISWIIPSTNFVVQQNSDLTTTNWSVVTNLPVLNLTNLQNEVALPLSGSNGFFRLKTP